MQALTTAYAARSPDDEIAALRRENKRLKQELKAVTPEAVTPLSTASPSRTRHYKVDRIQLEGTWQGKYRARYGFRVIGLYDSEEEAARHISLHAAQAHHRVRSAGLARARAGSMDQTR